MLPCPPCMKAMPLGVHDAELLCGSGTDVLTIPHSMVVPTIHNAMEQLMHANLPDVSPHIHIKVHLAKCGGRCSM